MFLEIRRIQIYILKTQKWAKIKKLMTKNVKFEKLQNQIHIFCQIQK